MTRVAPYKTQPVTLVHVDNEVANRLPDLVLLDSGRGAVIPDGVLLHFNDDGRLFINIIVPRDADPSDVFILASYDVVEPWLKLPADERTDLPRPFALCFTPADLVGSISIRLYATFDTPARIAGFISRHDLANPSTRNDFMELAIQQAVIATLVLVDGKPVGGPFGAVIVRKGKLLCQTHNKVLLTCDPTAHAEVNAIRIACKLLGTIDLSDCTLFSSGASCPMCLSAAHWANISTVYYAASANEAHEAGYSDLQQYEEIRTGQHESILDAGALMQHLPHPQAKVPFTYQYELY